MAMTEANIEVDLDRLAKMDIRRLQALHRELFGAEYPVSNAGHLRRKIGWHVQARKHGGLPDSARVRALAIARETKVRVRMSDNLSRRKKGIPLDLTVTNMLRQPTMPAYPSQGRSS